MIQKARTACLSLPSYKVKPVPAGLRRVTDPFKRQWGVLNYFLSRFREIGDFPVSRFGEMIFLPLSRVRYRDFLNFPHA